MSIIGLKKNQKRMQGTLRFKTLSMALLCCASLAASPVIRKSITVTGPDGSELVLMPHGDEFGVWYTDTEGRVMVQDAQGNFVYGRPDAAVVNRARAAAQNRIGEMSIHEGSPRIPVILVSFADKDFSEKDPKAGFENRLCRAATRSEVEAGNGSAYQYFADQSDGKFTPEFEIIGPLKLSQPEASYVNREAEMVSEAVAMASEQGIVPDWSVYDSNGDGMVDASYVIFAGEGRHAHPQDMTLIWPQTSVFVNNPPQADGVTFHAYSCCNELLYDELDGFGTFCHEFSHQLGLPDFYRTDGGILTEFNMGPWSLMDYGGYNGGGYLPVGYRALEKWCMGWTEPVELDKAATVVGWPANAAPLKVSNNVDNSEYYILETIDGKGWNHDCPAEGILITHVYLPGGFNSNSWKDNSLNNSAAPSVHVIAADNERLQLVTGVNEAEYEESIRHDLYPNEAGNNELTDISTPAANVYVGLWGQMGKPITEMTYDAQTGRASFQFMGGDDQNVITSVNAPLLQAGAEEGCWSLDGLRWDKKPNQKGIYIVRDAQGNLIKVLR